MISYEWTSERVDEYDDIQDSDFSETLDQLVPGRIALIVREGDDYEGEQWREYAYVENGALPLEFPNGRKIPKRFHAELESSRK